MLIDAVSCVIEHPILDMMRLQFVQVMGLICSYSQIIANHAII